MALLWQTNFLFVAASSPPAANDRQAQRSCPVALPAQPPAPHSRSQPAPSQSDQSGPGKPHGCRHPLPALATPCDPACHWGLTEEHQAAHRPLEPCSPEASQTDIPEAPPHLFPEQHGQILQGLLMLQRSCQLTKPYNRQPTACRPPHPPAPAQPPREPQDDWQAAPRSLPALSDTHGSSPESRCDPKTRYCRPPNTGQNPPSDTDDPHTQTGSR